MTETSSLSTTQPLLQNIPVTAQVLSNPTLNGSPSDTLPPEEDYTIKCICDFEDDDGNTVFCERCETWQHIECYYHGKKVPEIHNCADCEPRSLDGKRATERQRRLRELNTTNNPESGDRKAKRPATKSHKKKVKETNSTSELERVNGWSHGRHESQSNPRDQPPPAKRPKTNHRNSGSVSSQIGTPTLSHETHKRAGSTHQTYPSPTKSPSSNGTHMPLYSTEFLHLYDEDPGETPMQGNVHNSISTASELSSWLKDPQALAHATTGRTQEEVFTFSDQSFDPSRWPTMSKQTKTDPSIEYEGRSPTWKYLKVQTDVRKDEIVGEVKGHIGLLQDYCLDPANRFKDLRHPEPFVFFHPYLPIYIDARKEGTLFRYVRRSCRPNLALKTYITNDVEYHFCFVAKEDIPAGSEVTAMWYLDPQLFNRPASSGMVKDEDSPDDDPDHRPIWASQVLANFGDCACLRPPACSFSPVDLRQPPNTSMTKTNGKRKRLKPKQGVSPMSTGHATNSRAGSEALKMPDDDDQADSRSTSGSIRSKPHSRDLTPTSGGTAEMSGFPGTELSERERRKTAAVEKLFQQQDSQIPKRKKRSSGGTNPSGQNSSIPRQSVYSTASQPTTPNVTTKAGYTDASTSQGETGSPKNHVRSLQLSSAPFRASNPSPKRRSAPNTPYIPSPLSKPVYVDRAIQCDRDEFDPEFDKTVVWKLSDHFTLPPPPPGPKRPYVPQYKRLLEMARKARQDTPATEQQYATPLQPSAAPLQSSVAEPIALDGGLVNGVSVNSVEADIDMVDADISTQSVVSDVQMTDDQSESLPLDKVPSNPESTFKPPPPPWPSTAAHVSPLLQPLNGYRATELRVQLPPTPHFSNPSPTTPSLSQLTPSSATGPIGQSPWSLPSAPGQPALQTPGSSAVAPSPVKKKLSLGDYMSRRSNLAPTGDKSSSAITQSQLQQPNTSPKVTAATISAANLPKPNESFEVEVKEQDVEGSAIADTPMVEAGDPTSRTTTTTTTTQSTEADPK